MYEKKLNIYHKLSKEFFPVFEALFAFITIF